jgi:hypothetical protein
MNLILSYSEFMKPLTALMREGKNSTYLHFVFREVNGTT